jgi:hypothetical protein
MVSPKVKSHPQKNTIIKWMLNGKSLRWICSRLKELNPEDTEFHVSVPTLQKFRREHIRLDKDALEKRRKERQKEEQKLAITKEHVEIKNLPSYSKKVENLANVHLNIKESLLKMEALIEERLKQLFNRAQSGNVTAKEEALLQGYFDRYITVIEKWAKYIDKVADIRVEADINVNLIQDQMACIRQVILDTLHEMNPDDAVEFLSKLNNRMSNTEYKSKESFPQTRRDIEALPEFINKGGLLDDN